MALRKMETFPEKHVISKQHAWRAVTGQRGCHGLWLHDPKLMTRTCPLSGRRSQRLKGAEVHEKRTDRDIRSDCPIQQPPWDGAHMSINRGEQRKP